MTLTEKVAYIKGLVAALETDKNDKVFSAVLDLLSDLAATVSDLDDKSEYLEKYIEEVDEDLGALEDEFYGVRRRVRRLRMQGLRRRRLRLPLR